MTNNTSDVGSPTPISAVSDAYRVTTAAQISRAPSVWHCALMIAVVKLVLTTRGFASTLRLIRTRVAATQVAPLADVDLVRATEHAVSLAAALYPGRAKCLERSLVLFYELRTRGVRAQYVQGVQARPFAAHAWIEYAGRPVNDVIEHTRAFVRLPETLL